MKWQVHNVGSLYSYYYDLVMLLIYITLVCRDNNQSCYLSKLLDINKKKGEIFSQKSCSLSWERTWETYNYYFNF